MLFNSLRYIVFLVLVVLLYWRLPVRFHRVFLLIASYLFYMNWFPVYGLLILALTTANYWLGLRLATITTHRRLWLWLAVGFNLGGLAFFKYANFILDNIRVLAGFAHQDFSIYSNIILPLGISFFTFEFIHYVVDVYRGNAPIRSWIDFALFPAFFPTQIAGPIKRYENFMPQLLGVHHFDVDNFQNGLRLIVRGLFKKIVLADNLTMAATAGFDGPLGLGAADAWVTVLAFTLQIYFDFSGYTDIGRGSAALLGFDVPENFNLPYLASNISDFWRRWHISLSSWLKDYLYIPLGGSRCTRTRNYLNILVTMTLGGLWHGASWTFVIWGAYQGVGLLVHREWERLTARWTGMRRTLGWRIVAWGLTLGFVIVGWVFFRAATLVDALVLLSRMSVIGSPRLVGNLDPDHWLTTLSILFGYASYLGLSHWIKSAHYLGFIRKNLWLVRAAMLAAMVLAILAFPGNQASFIYFQF